MALIDAEPGATRSEKIESMLRRYRDVRRDLRLREELAAFGEGADDRVETEAWGRIMEDM